MKLKQLSLFLENKPGNVRKACRTLADNGLNIETMSLADTEQFGILRVLVKDWQKAQKVFEEHNIVVRDTEVIAVAVKNHAGGLADILDIIDEAGLNIEYMYGLSHTLGEKAPTTQADGCAIILFRFDNPDAAVEKLQAKGVKILGNDEIFS